MTEAAAERAALALAVAAGALIPLNSTMLAVGLPDIARDLGVGRGTTATLVTAYLVAMLVCQPLGGRAGDRFGNRRVVRLGLGAFVLASVGAGVAPSFGVLLVGRCAQAVAGAALIPNSQAILRAIVHPGRRGRMFGFVGTGIGAGAAAGPVLGGILSGGLGWRGIFLVNVPLGLLALALSTRVHPEAPGVPREETTASEAPEGGARARILRSATFRAACITQTTSNFALYTVLLVLPVMLADRGWSGAGIGLATSGLTAGLLVLGPLGGALGDRRGRTLPVVTGLSTVVVGTAVLAAGSGSAAALVAGPLVMGIGMGLSGASLQASALEAVPQEVTGAAAGLYSASRYVGSIAGSLAIAATGVEGASTATTVLTAAVVCSVLATIAGRRAVADARLER